MSHIHKGTPGASLEILQLEPQRRAQLCVEARERLVHQNEFRLAHERSSERDTLPFSPRQLARIAPEVDREPRLGRTLVHSPFNLVARDAPKLQRKSDVLKHRHVW